MLYISPIELLYYFNDHMSTPGFWVGGFHSAEVRWLERRRGGKIIYII